MQGVGFRYFVRQKAAEFSITGWVRNLPNSDVEIEAHGTKINIETFIDWIKTGPPAAVVSNTNISYFNTEKIPDRFELRF